MLYYLKKYPISLAIIAVVIYLSFFKPPSMEIGKIPGMDKVVHVCMYAGVSGMLWLEFLRNHRKYDDVLWHAWIGAVLCPILMSGVIELLQEYCTTYRGGDWFDFLANITGVALATLFANLVLRPWMMKKKKIMN
ncbi:VanZ family protein [Parabacteroides sp.]